VTATHEQLVNWSGSHRYQATEVHHPDSVDALRRLLAGASGTLQVLGTRHTFTEMGDADALIALDRFPGATTIEIDAATMTARVGPGVTYARLAEALHARGLGLENLASLPHISVAGAVATATHGSGDGLGNLATSVVAIELVCADGDRLVLERADPRFPGAVVHLGALGVVVAVTLALVPTYALRQDVFLDLEWDALASEFETIMSLGRSVSVFHDFGERARQVWVKSDPAGTVPSEVFGARAAREPCHPVPGGSPETCTEQLGRPGPWHERLPHFRSGYTPSAGREIQSEFFVARGDAIAALFALRGLADRIRPVLQIAELRVVEADQLWLSPHHARSSAGLHFTWALEPGPVAAACAEVERALAPFAPRPHPGKLFTAAPPDAERAGDFRALRAQLDPRGVFANVWLRAQRLVD
jgi:alditol oxidase